jgi:hypothetical protein
MQKFLKHKLQTKNPKNFQIGYNGLGFCCPEPENAKRDNAVCEAKSPRRTTANSNVEESECRVDADCSETEKCCFNGAVLKCTLGRPAIISGVRRPTTSNKIATGVLGENKGEFFGLIFCAFFYS